MNSNRSLIIIIILIVIIVGGGWYLAKSNLLPWQNKTADTMAKPTDWQAVFLSNGQVYFGKLTNENSQFISLEQIYYLQVQQPADAKATPAPNQQQISLIKLGSELHGPVDSMKINRQHVLFIEQMKSDAKVVEAIERYIKQGPAAANTNPSLSGTPAPTTTTSPSASPRS